MGIRILTEKDYDELVQMIQEAKQGSGGSAVRITEVELLAANWQTEKEGKYYQNFDIAAVNTNCKFSVGVDDDFIERMQDKVLTLEAKCVENGVVKVLAIGDKPTLDFVVQLTFQEVVWL